MGDKRFRNPCSACQLTASECRYWQYSRSKLCNVMLTGELQRRLRQAGSRIQAYAVSPGLVATSIFDSAAGPFKGLVQPVIQCIAKTPAQVGPELSLPASCSSKLAARDCC